MAEGILGYQGVTLGQLILYRDRCHLLEGRVAELETALFDAKVALNEVEDNVDPVGAAVRRLARDILALHLSEGVSAAIGGVWLGGRWMGPFDKLYVLHGSIGAEPPLSITLSVEHATPLIVEAALFQLREQIVTNTVHPGFVFEPKAPALPAVSCAREKRRLRV